MDACTHFYWTKGPANRRIVFKIKSVLLLCYVYVCQMNYISRALAFRSKSVFVPLSGDSFFFFYYKFLKEKKPQILIPFIYTSRSSFQTAIKMVYASVSFPIVSSLFSHLVTPKTILISIIQNWNRDAAPLIFHVNTYYELRE